ncbi:MAG: sulfotransferase family protein [Nannocystales bacterium]
MTIHARQFTTSARTQPWWYAALNTISAILPAGKFDASAWVRAAVDAAGEEPEADVRDAFESLVHSLEADSGLGVIGKVAAREDCTRRLLEHLKARPVVRAAQLDAPASMPSPIYVLGWMRSGTTALHQLLAADPEHWSPRHYETMFPVSTHAGAEDPRWEQVAAVLAELRRVSPNYQAIHPMRPDNPEECLNLFAHSFRTPQFAVQFRVPSYLRWLQGQDPNIAYGRYVEELGILRRRRGGGSRMVLKDPTHIGYLPALLERFPSAKFVFIHRDPVDVFSSMSSMYAYTRAIFSRDIDPKTIGPELFDDPLLDAHAAGVACCDSLGAGRVAHVRHQDFCADPVASARAVYETLDIGWSAPGEAAVREHAARPRPDHKHEHSPEAFGLRPAAMRERLADYCERFDL